MSPKQISNEAQIKYIAYMDGDDISEKQRIATQVAFLETNCSLNHQ